ncbi:MAG: TetR/AcrR family transcriptional regulator [Ignavibacteria bacterium]|jgi:TetR/AcrR family fatty acid metabolism transcriptional regulator
MRIKEGNKEEDILKAAISVFAESGYHNAKMSKISEVAEVATGSLYVYYKNKEQILLKIFDIVWEKLHYNLLVLVKREDLNPIEKFDAMIDMIFDAFTESPAIAIVIANEQHHLQFRRSDEFTEYFEKFLNLGEKIVNEGIKNKSFNPNVDVKIFRYFLLGGFRELITNWAENNDEFKLNRIRQNIKFLAKNGILNHKKS